MDAFKASKLSSIGPSSDTISSARCPSAVATTSGSGWILTSMVGTCGLHADLSGLGGALRVVGRRLHGREPRFEPGQAPVHLDLDRAQLAVENDAHAA